MAGQAGRARRKERKGGEERERKEEREEGRERGKRERKSKGRDWPARVVQGQRWSQWLIQAGSRVEIEKERKGMREDKERWRESEVKEKVIKREEVGNCMPAMPSQTRWRQWPAWSAAISSESEEGGEREIDSDPGRVCEREQRKI